MSNIPTGFDWGDGVTELPSQPIGSGGPALPFGTPTPAEALLIRGPGGVSNFQPPQEDPSSPEIERAEQATISHVMKMGWSDGVNLILGLGRGTFLQDSSGNITRILSSKIKKLPKNQCELTVIAESISFDTPPDEFQIVPIDLGLDIIKNPRYSWALAPIDSDTASGTPVGDIVIHFVAIKSALIRLIQAYRDSPFFPSSDQVNGLIQNNVMGQLSQSSDGKAYLSVQVPVLGYDSTQPLDPVDDNGLFKPPQWNGVFTDLPPGNYPYVIVSVPVDISSTTDPITIAMAAAKEIISKLWRQEDTPYLTGYQMTWTQYFFAPAYLDPGGYIQDPISVVPDYFIQPEALQSTLAQGDFSSPFGNQDTAPPNSGQATIFDKISILNPQSYSSTGIKGGPLNISWLRKSDEVEYQRTWFRVSHTWIGSPIGTWDSDLYTHENRPQNSLQFDQLI